MKWFHSILPYGKGSVLLTGVSREHIARLEDIIIKGIYLRGGIDSLLISYSPDVSIQLILPQLEAHLCADMQDEPFNRSSAFVLPTQWNGEDLNHVAESLNKSPQQVIAEIEESSFEVALIGFAPGFPYLVPAPNSAVSGWADIPRLSVPRKSVPAGSIGLAAGMACIYPSALPGGWNLIGSTATTLFDAQLDSPSLLTRGDTVRFSSGKVRAV